MVPSRYYSAGPGSYSLQASGIPRVLGPPLSTQMQPRQYRGHTHGHGPRAVRTNHQSTPPGKTRTHACFAAASCGCWWAVAAAACYWRIAVSDDEKGTSARLPVPDNFGERTSIASPQVLWTSKWLLNACRTVEAKTFFCGTRRK